MKVLELFSSVRNTLQDIGKDYWDDSELLSYYNECKRSMASERLENKTTATLILDPLKNEYDTSGILRYIHAKDDNGLKRELYPNDESGDEDNNGIIIQDYNRVYVNDSTVGSIVTFQIVAMPNDDNLTSDVRAGDENSFKYYILSKAYEKDADVQNFEKSTYFYNKYTLLFKPLKNASSANYTTNTVQVTAAKYY